MRTDEQTEDTSSPEQKELSIIRQGAQGLGELSMRIAPRFKRAEARKRVGRYLRGLIAPVERKNGWQMAEELGDPNVHGVQRLLAEADWDEEAVRDDLRAYVIEHLGEASGVLVVDETGFVKKGKKSAGVARQYSGTAGRRENSQVGVFLGYASSKGYAFIDRALYLPEEWTSDRVRCREAGIPDEVEFATKGELAKRMLERAFAAGVPAEWVVGDTVYGYEELRIWLDEQHKNYVLAVPETHAVWVQGRQQPVGLLAALLPPQAWVVLSAGEDRRGPRLYEWAWLQLPDETAGQHKRARFLLIRRSLADTSKRAYYRVAGPAQTTLPEVVQVAGSRWKIEEGYEQAKGEVGLDQYEVRTWRAWYRYITLALLAYAALVIVQGQARALEKKRGGTDERIDLSVPEVRRLLHALGESEEQQAQRLRWSRFRRQHQARAQRFHVLRRARQAPAVSLDPPAPWRVLGLPALTEAHWEQLRPLLPPQKPQTGRPAIDHRLVVEGMLWVMRTGSSWRELPERFGPWSTVSSRYQRWCKEGVWQRILQVLLPQDALPCSASP